MAKARLEDMRHQLEFVEQVKDKRAVSAEEVSRRRSAVDTAEAELRATAAETAAGESLVRLVRTEIDRSTIAVYKSLGGGWPATGAY